MAEPSPETYDKIITKINEEILSLKKEAVSEDAKGHSCNYCKPFKFRPWAAFDTDWEHVGGDRESAVDTTEKQVRNMAASGCDFWAMINDQITYLELKERAERRRGSDRYSLNWSERRYEKLVTSLGQRVAAEFWRLHRNRAVAWIDCEETAMMWDSLQDPRPAPRIPETVVGPSDFVRVSIGPDSRKEDDVGPFKIRVTLKVARKAQKSVWLPWKLWDNVSEITLKKYQAFLIALASPGSFTGLVEKHVASPMNLSPGSTATVSLIKLWLKKCEIEHQCGISNCPLSMPSMVLQVSDQDVVRLIKVPPTTKERYIALSYCWGKKAQKVLLTKETMSRLTSGISPQELDSTIRDSIIVARELGFEFLWVDALCILQDDEHFKTKELRRMDDIYRHASFTIVASAAAGVGEGFLKKRASTIDTFLPVAGNSRVVFELKAERGTDGPSQQVPVYLRPDKLDEVEPWYNRAWTLQEALFSGRRLQYRANQTTWICYCSKEKLQECDGWAGGIGHTYLNFCDGGALGKVMEVLWGRQDIPQHDVLLEYWYDLVEIYTSREMTYQRDRLPAISGIAREFSSILKEKYLFGLWKSGLATGLVWSLQSPRLGLHPDSGTSPMGAPSWSWGSAGGSVQWSGRKLYEWHGREVSGWKQNDDFEILTCELLDEANAVDLCLRGLTMSLPSSATSLLEKKTIKIGNASIDVDLDRADDHRLQPGYGLKIEMLAIINVGQRAVIGILIVEEGEQKYSRVGVFKLEGIWPRGSELKKTHEEHRHQIRSIWGGDKNIRAISLI
ncbi:het domain containing protein [Colletotrichum truncatum]|uniref:Het domain containing protein n=1 Tax=Colletotrichum truncatum TaxID=5467 RepID=A0ACC3ZCT2_COLTU|nr:het domain containing protein [Colletotrichum truncatum]KAF6797889.1 het domain containing protein [Colletotrichum truncatum]